MQFEQTNQEVNLKGEVFDPFFDENQAEVCFEEPKEI